MAARGGSIDQLISNLGRHYAGGGIVAFNGEEDSDIKDEDVKKKLQQYTLQQQGADWVARKEAERLAEAEADARRQALVSQIPTGGQQAPASTGPMPGEAERNISNAMAAMPGASAAKGFAGGVRGLLAALAGMGDRESSVPAPATAGRDAVVDPEVQRLKALAAARAQTGQNATPAVSAKPPVANVPASPRPTVVNTGIAGAGKPEVVEPTDPLEAAIRKSAMETLAKDPEEVRRRAIEANAKAMGLDALLKPAQERVANREAMVKRIQENRQPLWIDALMSAGKPTKGGLAGVLSQMATGVNATKQGYDVEDLKFIDELNKLNEGIDKARIEGRYKDVAAGETAVKDLIADRRQAEQSGTSLLTNKETARSREQIAKEGRLSREQTAALAAQGRADALAGKTDVAYREQAMKLAMAAALKEMQLPANMAKYKNTTAEELAATKFNSIYNALKSGKMGAAPSAESPSGTSKPGWGIKPI